MSLALFELKKKIEPTKIWTRYVGKIDYVSGSKADFKIPTDHFIHAINIRIELGSLSGGTDPSWNSDANEKIVKSIRLVGDGTKVIKNYDWDMMKNIAIVNREKLPDGYGKIYFTDPKISEAKPLPAWIFTSLILEVEFESLSNLTSGSPTSGEAYVHLTLVESSYQGEDLSTWKILVEQYPRRESFGTNTGIQEYRHDRSYDVYGFLYKIDDNGTLSNTAIEYINIIGRTREAEFNLISKGYIGDLRMQNQIDFGNALDTGFVMVEFPRGLSTYQFTSLKTQFYIKTAGTDVGVKVLERYLL